MNYRGLRPGSNAARAIQALALARPTAMRPCAIRRAIKHTGNPLSFGAVLTDLESRGLAERPTRGFWRITPRGFTAYQQLQQRVAKHAGPPKDHLGNAERVRRVLRAAAEPLSTADVAAIAGLTKHDAGIALSNLAGRGWALRTSDGRWIRATETTRIDMGQPTAQERLFAAHKGLAANLGMPTTESELYDRGERAYVAHCADRAGIVL